MWHRMMHGVSDESDERHGGDTGAGMSSPEEARLRALTLGRGGSMFTINLHPLLYLNQRRL